MIHTSCRAGAVGFEEGTGRLDGPPCHTCGGAANLRLAKPKCWV